MKRESYDTMGMNDFSSAGSIRRHSDNNIHIITAAVRVSRSNDFPISLICFRGLAWSRCIRAVRRKSKASSRQFDSEAP